MSEQKSIMKAPKCAVFDYKGVEQELTDMAAKGWQIEQIDRRRWIYKKAEPAKIRYETVFCKDANGMRYEESEGQKTLEEMCRSQGWEKVGQWEKMIIFSSADENAVPPETDEYVKLQNAKSAMRNTVAIRAGATLLVPVMFMVMIGAVLLGELPEYPHMYLTLSVIVFAPMFTLAIILEILEISGYFLWLKKSEENLERGGRCADADTISRRVYYCYKAMNCCNIATLALLVAAVMSLGLI